jgi:hypothetical protein
VASYILFRVLLKKSLAKLPNGHKKMLQFFGLNDTSRTVKTIAKMAAGNLRTAANNDQDDDPRALVPIPIATREMTSLVERLNPGVNAEVVRVSLANFFFPQRLSMIARRVTRPERRVFVLHSRQKNAKKVERKGVGRLFPGVAIVEARDRSLRGRSWPRI